MTSPWTRTDCLAAAGENLAAILEQRVATVRN